MVEMQFADFVSVGFNQIVNNLAKLHYRWGQNVDVVVRMPTGAGVGAGPFHSQSNEAWFYHIPGLKIVYAHAAIPYYREVWDYAKKKENVFVDLSSTVYTSQAVLSRVIQILGATKCLHGTDGPYAEATQERMLNRIQQLSISDEEREHILGGNFLDLIRV